jgi:hypothetical protein
MFNILKQQSTTNEIEMFLITFLKINFLTLFFIRRIKILVTPNKQLNSMVVRTEL